MKKILITGICGFIGSNLAKRLLDEYEIIGVDNLITGNMDNIKPIIDKIEFYNIDICNTEFAFLDNKKIHYIIHLACPASPIFYKLYPIDTLRTCSLGTENVLRLAMRQKCVVLVASSSEVYGDSKINPQTEEYFGNVNTFGPRSCYDEGKRYMEALCYSYQQLGCKIRIARIFNTYGPNMREDDGRVIPAFLKQKRMDQSFTIFGDGTQTRSLCYISDTIDGLLALLYSDYSLPINIGNPRELSILEIAKIIDENRKIVFFWDGRIIDDPKQRQPDITKAKTILNWEPKISFEEGIHFLQGYNSVQN